jgi:hypothetical protein
VDRKGFGRVSLVFFVDRGSGACQMVSHWSLVMVMLMEGLVLVIPEALGDETK